MCPSARAVFDGFSPLAIVRSLAARRVMLEVMTTEALDDALERWRAHRTVAFAQLVTAIGRRVPDAELEAPEPDDDAAIARLLARPDDPPGARRLADVGKSPRNAGASSRTASSSIRG
jgi:hypothetical protein